MGGGYKPKNSWGEGGKSSYVRKEEKKTGGKGKGTKAPEKRVLSAKGG